LVKDKLDPKFNGNYKVIEQIKSGNYKLRDEKGELLSDSYPRWKLKEIKEECYKTNTKISENDIKAIIDYKKTDKTTKYYLMISQTYG